MDTVALADHDVARSVYLREQDLHDGGDRIYLNDEGDNEDHDPRFWKLRNEFLPKKVLGPGGDLVSALRWSDFYSLSEMRNTPFMLFTSNQPSARQVPPIRPPPGRTGPNPAHRFLAHEP